jgi:hypothetical protein
LADAFRVFLLSSSFSRTEAFSFCYLFHARKVGVPACDKLPLQENASYSLEDRRVSWPKSRASASRWQIGRILVFCHFFLGRTSVDVERPFAPLSMGIVGKAGSLPSIPGTFLGLGFGNGDRGWGCILCVCSRVGICADCAYLGLQCLCLRKSVSLPHSRKWKWFMGASV